MESVVDTAVKIALRESPVKGKEWGEGRWCSVCPPTFSGWVTEGLSKIYSTVDSNTRFLETTGIPTNCLRIQDKIWQREFCVLTDTTVSMNEIHLKRERKKELSWVTSLEGCKNLHQNGNVSKMELSRNDFIHCLRWINVQNTVIPVLCKLSAKPTGKMGRLFRWHW